MKVNAKLMSKTINIFLMYIFVFSLIFTPNDPLNIIKICLLLLLFINFNLILKNVYVVKYKLIIFYGLIFPILLFIFSLINSENIYDSVAGVYFFTYLLLIFLLAKYNINYEKILILSLCFVSLITISSALLDLLNILGAYENPMLYCARLSGNISIGKGKEIPLYYMLRFHSSPLLIFFVGYTLYKKKLLYIFIAFFASILSGTRANIFAPFIVLFLFVIFIYNKNTKYKHVITFMWFIFIGFVICFSYPYIHPYILDMFQRKASSDLIRDLYYLSYFKLFSNIDIVLFGQGFGAFFYSYGREQFTSTAELAYWEFIRQFGLINFIVFLLFLLIPILKLYRIKEARWILISYFVYLLISYHNPNLYNSLSFLVYSLMYYSLFSFKKVKHC